MSPDQARAGGGGVLCNGPFAGAAKTSEGGELRWVPARATALASAGSSGLQRATAGFSGLQHTAVTPARALCNSIPVGVWPPRRCGAADGNGHGEGSIFTPMAGYRHGGWATSLCTRATPRPDPHGLCKSAPWPMMEAGDRLRVSRDAVSMWLRPWSQWFLFFTPFVCVLLTHHPVPPVVLFFVGSVDYLEQADQGGLTRRARPSVPGSND
ncbi:hypothetical protein B0J13DRAFT_607946 [Dactylonectria estremocensis]|uniref:Uncharacterized protein n=1 Tax=Dactylonectria estremocensis TaxID=1079267 RepID=A0A9P9J373_9HYPO|nr:hypothetical protein B0J13DRAFT_607946 [Dactylonectria estremocensis]